MMFELVWVVVGVGYAVPGWFVGRRVARTELKGYPPDPFSAMFFGVLAMLGWPIALAALMWLPKEWE